MTTSEPRAPLGHLARLDTLLVAPSRVDDVVGAVLAGLASLPGVRRVGLGLSEGGGRRLQFTASDRPRDRGIEWCHIDAYDDVPLTSVARSGVAMVGAIETFDQRYATYLQKQPADVRGLAALPLSGPSSAIGGLVLFVDETWTFGPERLRLLAAVAERVADAVQRTRSDGGATIWSDLPVDLDAATTARLALDDDPRAPGLARRFLRDVLADAGLPSEMLATAELCLSELVTNVILHAGSSTELVVALDAGPPGPQELRVAVRDHGGPPDRPSADAPVPWPDEDPFRVHGRGLQLVEALADQWGAERDEVGTTVWFTLRGGE